MSKDKQVLGWAATVPRLPYSPFSTCGPCIEAGDRSVESQIPLIDLSQTGRRTVIFTGGLICMCGAGSALAEGEEGMNAMANKCRECAGVGAIPCEM